jgi:hypothetical protein
MHAVLSRLEAGLLDTNVSVAAVCGLDGAEDGMRAVESRSIWGKIIVYPACRGLGLERIEDLSGGIPEVGRLLDKPPRAPWNAASERRLLELYGKKSF